MRNLLPNCLHLAAVVVCGAAPSIVHSQAKAIKGAEDPTQPCGIIYEERYGPFDYRWDQDKLKIVEDFHFTPRVESLRAGQSGYIGGDLNYTLMSFPNHHRALIALVKYTERLKVTKANGMKYPVECYFDRALRFAPDDTKARSLFAQYLQKNNRGAEALEQLDVATRYAGDNGVAHYNIGIVYYQLRAYDKALVQARKAKELGVPDGQLESLLKKAGQWKDLP